MKAIGPSLLCLFSCALLAVVTGTATQNVHPSHYAASFNRTLFPSDFLFGIGSSAYQVHTTTLLATMHSIIYLVFNLFCLFIDSSTLYFP